jgi:hypothetical protein
MARKSWMAGPRPAMTSDFSGFLTIVIEVASAETLFADDLGLSARYQPTDVIERPAHRARVLAIAASARGC